MDEIRNRAEAGGQAPQGEQEMPSKERQSGVGHSSGDRNEDQYLNDTATGEQDPEPRGRGASGESYEDEADNALFRRSRHPDVDGRGTQ